MKHYILRFVIRGKSCGVKGVWDRKIKRWVGIGMLLSDSTKIVRALNHLHKDGGIWSSNIQKPRP